MTAAVDVAVGIILDRFNGKVLVARRISKDTHHGKWEFPGGKINPQESAGDALKRELSEELGISVLIYERLESLVFNYSEITVNLNFFLVPEFAGQARGLDGQKIRWVNISDLPQLDMLEANSLIIGKLMCMSGDPGRPA